jgi:hypothetical protein
MPTITLPSVTRAIMRYTDDGPARLYRYTTDGATVLGYTKVGTAYKSAVCMTPSGAFFTVSYGNTPADNTLWSLSPEEAAQRYFEQATQVFPFHTAFPGVSLLDA